MITTIIRQDRGKVRFRRFVTVVLVALVAVVGSVGIVSSQQPEEKAVKEGQEQGKAKLQLPEGFPKDIPIYPKSAVTSFYLGFSEDFEGGGLGTGFESPAKYDKVYDWLKTELKKNGWGIIQDVDMTKLGGGIQCIAGKDDSVIEMAITAEKEKETTSWAIVGDLARFLPEKELEKCKQPRNYLAEDIPLHADSEMLGVALDLENVSVQFKSKEEPVKMARHLIEQFEKAGWKIGDKMGAEEAFASFGAEKEKRAGTVNITVKENTSTGEKFSRMNYIFKR